MDSFEKAFANTVGLEGGYSDNQNDAGGKTKYGITEKVARTHGYAGEMKDLPLGLAQKIYRESYWDINRLGDVAAISEPVALELFDTGVNAGVGVAGTMFQQALNVLNRGGHDFNDVPVDGRIGSLSVAAFSEYMSRRKDQGERVMLLALNSLQGAKYIELAEKCEKDEEFVFGWLAKRVSL
jgi:lysozyme family protein